jgi:hypothetical protein
MAVAAANLWEESELERVAFLSIERAGAESEVLANVDDVSVLSKSGGESRGGEQKLKVNHHVQELSI